jgi:hypothetical protein
MADGQRGIELRGLFQKMRYQTASFDFTPEERTEYELYHKLAAKDDNTGAKSDVDRLEKTF